ncbi:Oxysterol-binding protein 3 [Dimargaris xerosporica]|nr:Oxysterol-binding protein 3 [Dimargaris xerosporica]
MQEIVVPPKDMHLHYVQVTQPDQKILWWFSTKRKNISFGLYYKRDSRPVSTGLIVSDSTRSLPPSRRASVMPTTAQQSTRSLLAVKPTGPTGTDAASTHTRGNDAAESGPESGTSPTSPTASKPLPNLASGFTSHSSPARRRKARLPSTANRAAQVLDLTEVVPIEHYDSAKAIVKGQYFVAETGTYVLCFDNTYSLTTSKVLSYFVGVAAAAGSTNAQPWESMAPWPTGAGVPSTRTSVATMLTAASSQAPGVESPTAESAHGRAAPPPIAVDSFRESALAPKIPGQDAQLVVDPHWRAEVDTGVIARSSMHISGITADAEMEGWLLKKKRIKMQGWAKRWVKLHRGVLSYSKAEHAILRGAIQIAMAVVSVVPNQRIINVDTGSTLYQFKTLTDQGFNQWFEALQTVKDKAHNWGIPLAARPSFADIPPTPSRSPSAPASPIQASLLASIRGLKPAQIIGQLQDVHTEATRELAAVEAFLDTLSSDPSAIVTQASELESQVAPLREVLARCRQHEQWYYACVWELAKAYARTKSRNTSLINLHRSSSGLHRTGSRLNKSAPRLASRSRLLNPSNSEGLRVSSHSAGQGSTFFTPRSDLAIDPMSFTLGDEDEDAFHDLTSLPSDDDLFYDALDASLIEDVVVADQEADQESLSSHSKSEPVSTASDDDTKSSQLSLNELPSPSNGIVNGTGIKVRSPLVSPRHTVRFAPEYTMRAATSPAASQKSLTRSFSNESFSSTTSHTQSSAPALSTAVAANTVVRRSALPSTICCEPISIVHLLRKNIGKDLTSVAMPITLNEPLSALQSKCEDFEYFSLLHQAITSPDALDRLMYIAAFAISSFAGKLNRGTRKPFNPMLGETYEFSCPEQGYRFLSEKVSHHPPVLAGYAEGKGFQWWQETRVKNKFWGKSMEIIPEGLSHLHLEAHGDYFTYSKPSTWVRNMMSANKYLEFSGEVELLNHRTGDVAKITFKESGYFSSSNNEVAANLYRGHQGRKPTIMGKTKPDRQLTGRWDEQLVWSTASSASSGTRLPHVLWQAHCPRRDPDDMYGLTDYAIALNDLTADLFVDPEQDHPAIAAELANQDPTVSRNVLVLLCNHKLCLPSTDSRLRPDQRLFELGHIDQAEQEKLRLEQQQRERRLVREENGLTWTPRWFAATDGDSDPKNPKASSTQHPEPSPRWVYKGQYWESRTAHKFGDEAKLW